MRTPVALLAGVALDAAFGDPPNAAHPVAWFGRLARLVEARAPRSRVAGLLGAAGLVAGAGLLAARVPPRGVVGDAAVLWLAVSRRSLLARAREVARTLEADDLPEARRLLAHHLVSRDTSTLDASEVAAATIESVAENLSDGVVAPLWWYAVLGRTGAAGYRALNTLDGMWGYRDERFERFGWAAARADDLANLVPARLTALALVLAAGADAPPALRAWRSDRGRTDSPNAGHPMSAAAGALGVVLRKRGQYALGEGVTGAREPAAEDIHRAVRLADRAAAVALVLLVLAGARR